MSTITKHKFSDFDKALRLLDAELSRIGAPSYRLVICGGSALIAANLVHRTTKDVDILALYDEQAHLIDPEPLPSPLCEAARSVAENLSLPSDWINNGPSSGDGGLFRQGLPEGIENRLQEKRIGEKLSVFFVSRIDQIYFKLYAAVDQFGGYHASDLDALSPTDEELYAAAQWSMKHDPSGGYRQSVQSFLSQFGYETVSKRL